jgi:hypothetical protein
MFYCVNYCSQIILVLNSHFHQHSWKKKDYKEILFQNTKYLYFQRHISDIFQTSFETLKTSCQAPKI